MSPNHKSLHPRTLRIFNHKYQEGLKKSFPINGAILRNERPEKFETEVEENSSIGSGQHLGI